MKVALRSEALLQPSLNASSHGRSEPRGPQSWAAREEMTDPPSASAASPLHDRGPPALRAPPLVPQLTARHIPSATAGPAGGRPGWWGSTETRGSSPPRDGRAAAAGTGRARRAAAAALPLSSGSPCGHSSPLSAHLRPLPPRTRPARHSGRAPKVSARGAGRAAASSQLRPPPLLLPAAGGRGRGWDS